MRQLNLLLVSAIAVAGLALSSCIWIRSSSISDSTGKGTGVTAQAADMGYLELIPPQNLTQNAAASLASQCHSGKLGDVVTELSVRDFFAIVQMWQVDASGTCS